MSKNEPDEQMMLIDLPATPDAQEPVATPQSKRRAVKKLAPAATSTDLATPVPDTVPGVVLVDPRFIKVDPVNVRYGLQFDPSAQTELIDSMRIMGNSVPVRLRGDPDGDREYLCTSGSQRLGAALQIQREEPGFRLRAIIVEAMDDREAFALGEADNAGRTGVAPMQQARQWAKTLETVYGGDRQAFIAATGRSASVVSRTLSLAALPEHVLACCSDVEALTPYFAEQLTPRLADPDQAAGVERRAGVLITSGQRLPGAKLIRALLRDEEVKAAAAVTAWQSADGTRSVRYKVTSAGGRFEVVNVAGATVADRRGIMRAIATLMMELADTPSTN